MVRGTHSMLALRDVNGLATDASASDNEMPELAKKERHKIYLAFFVAFFVVVCFKDQHDTGAVVQLTCS